MTPLVEQPVGEAFVLRRGVGPEGVVRLRRAGDFVAGDRDVGDLAVSRPAS